MFRNSLSWCIFAFTFLELFLKTHLTFHDSSHGFISKNPRYFDDDLSNIHEEISSLRYPSRRETPVQLQLRFEPDILDFGERPLGIPHSETVKLYNTDTNKTLDMTSVSGNTVHFHSSFFEDKRVPPNSSTSFKVVFLGRQEGQVDSSLFIHTSEGFIKYSVKALGTFSGYRLRPIVGVKLPVNSMFSPLIYIHNPHSHPIQIVEIYSSGGGFHLELPTGEQEGPNDMWEILPQETKAIIRVRFEAKSVQNHTAYVRIKLHKPDEILIVPLEVEVTHAVSLYHPQGHVDFGMGGDMDGQKEVNLCLSNPGQRPIRVHSVSTTSKSIKVLYYNVRINYSDKNDACTQVGTLTVDWKTAWKVKDYHGKIIVKFRNGKNRTEIPYFVTVVKGGLSYDNMATTYFLNDKGADLTIRNFEAKNEYRIPIKVINITFPPDTDSLFKVENLTPKVIHPRAREVLFNIKLKNSIKKSDMELSSSIKLHTNITDVIVPLLSYNGKLQVNFPYKSDHYGLDAGLISPNTRKEYFFALINSNPVSLHVSNVYSSIPMTQVDLFGCGNGDVRTAITNHDFRNLTKCHSIRSKHFAVIRMTVTTSNIEGQLWGDVQINSPFENMQIPVRFKIAPGKIEMGPDKLVFDECFPGKICAHPIRVYSTFNEKMTVQDILSIPPDRRVAYVLHNSGIILPKNARLVGQVVYTPHVDCAPLCYTGLHTDTSAAWLQTFMITQHIAQYDLNLVNTFYNRYLNLTSNGLKMWQNFTFRMDTSEVRGHFFSSKAKLSWPSIVLEDNLKNRSTLEFPLSQIGNYTYKSITIHNPASYNLAVQLIFDKDYPHLDSLKLGLPPDLLRLSEDEKHMTDNGFFMDEDLKEKQQTFFWDRLKVKAHRETLPLLLAPNESQEIEIAFYTEHANVTSGLLFLRNNLTILEVIKLKAEGAMPSFKFGNRSPGGSQPLMFEMTERHMRDCERQRTFDNPQPNLTVKRTFTARNMGEITVYVNSFYINSYECEGHGFKVMDCEPFALEPNGTKRITIAFTPDLTLSKVTRTLILGTSLNVLVNYTLYTSIPANYINLCAEILPRPFWEKYLSMAAVSLLFFLFFAMVIISLIDAERIKREAIDGFVTSNVPNIQPVLDLRKVGQQTREEIQSSSSKEKSKDTEKEDIVVPEEMVETEKEVVDVGVVAPSETATELMEKTAKIEPAVIPATGKAKRKLAQRNSADEDEEDFNNDRRKEAEKDRRQKKKDILFQRHRLKSKERRAEKEQQLEGKGKKDKGNKFSNNNRDRELEKEQKRGGTNKKMGKNSFVCNEEETSSTTTESSSTSISSNCEEVENQKKVIDSKSTNNKCILFKHEISDVQKSNTNNNDNSRDHSRTSTFGDHTIRDINKQQLQSQQDNTAKHVSFVNNKFKGVASNKNVKNSGKQNKALDTEERLDEKVNHHYSHSRYHVHVRELKKRENKLRERKEKLIFRNKTLNDRKPSRISESDPDCTRDKDKHRNAFYIPLPTPTTVSSSIWGENKAKFSEIVARSEPTSTVVTEAANQMTTSSSNRPLAAAGKNISVSGFASRGTNIQSKSTSPYQQELGPIGSKRNTNDASPEPYTDSFFDVMGEEPTFNVEGDVNAISSPSVLNMAGDYRTLNDRSVIAAISGNTVVSRDSSFFSTNHDIRLDGGGRENSYLKEFASVSENWNRPQQMFKSFLDGDEDGKQGMSLTSTVKDPWSEDSINSYWSNSFGDVVTSSPSSEAATNNPSSYLWGSNPVWQPWRPSEAPSTPRRTPPGFDEIQRKDQQERTQQRDTYSPFNTTNIWTQQQNNPWNYEGSQ